MNLDEAQTTKVREWIESGLSAAAIQTRLQEELGIKMTYAEVRFLLGDLQLRPKDVPKAATPILGTPGAGGAGGGGPAAAAGRGPVPSSAPAPSPMSGPPPMGSGPGPGGLRTSPMDEAQVPGGGGISVSVDQIARPSMVVSGKVTFSDGETAEWGIDQMGRPRLMPKTAGYRPSQADIMDFQAELEQVLGRLGY